MTFQLSDRPGGHAVAVRHRPATGTAPTILFLPGYASDMMGSKAIALDAVARREGLGMLRFDYRGTGESQGRFADFTLGDWLEDASAVAAQAEGPLLLVGSSMGGWLMLHLAERLGDRVAALVGIAAAPDFTDWGYSGQDKATLAAEGELRRDNPYGGEAELTTLALWQSGERMRLLDRPIGFGGPVRLLHGDCDAEVPVEVALRLKDALASTDVQLTIVKGGTHRLSAPRELALLERTVLDLAASIRRPISPA
ncbi:alpha/beta hydrolase family protein [Sphingomonas glaciei]|uniref:Alpha/beta hydrolase n=1 Tax=Sphingomonas glaciei TaxID=2938948 RepID=A0ABY5MYU0_9SPHN|nr:alpha/beta hydrolase [Sphingomonas glaciei]UUR07516.1 alpha/beta hydrolase [Sphingomonas glaciei]